MWTWVHQIHVHTRQGVYWYLKKTPQPVFITTIGYGNICPIDIQCDKHLTTISCCVVSDIQIQVIICYDQDQNINFVKYRAVSVEVSSKFSTYVAGCVMFIAMCWNLIEIHFKFVWTMRYIKRNAIWCITVT